MKHKQTNVIKSSSKPASGNNNNYQTVIHRNRSIACAGVYHEIKSFVTTQVFWMDIIIYEMFQIKYMDFCYDFHQIMIHINSRFINIIILCSPDSWIQMSFFSSIGFSLSGYSWLVLFVVVVVVAVKIFPALVLSFPLDKKLGRGNGGNMIIRFDFHEREKKFPGWRESILFLVSFFAVYTSDHVSLVDNCRLQESKSFFATLLTRHIFALQFITFFVPKLSLCNKHWCEYLKKSCESIFGCLTW